MNELELQAAVSRGDNGDDVRRVQEWLCLDGYAVKLDGDFGPATEAAVRSFQSDNGLAVDGVVSLDTFARLVAPMQAALRPIAVDGQSLGALVVAYAAQHLAQRPREVGGDNCGPWVRLYMAGHDGKEWCWCAGFACFCLKQAAAALGVPPPIASSFSCDTLGTAAKQAGTLLDGGDAATAARLAQGSFLLVRRPTGGGWHHTGIVTATQAEICSTIEGNSNDDGSRNGYEVVAHTRGYPNLDFIQLG
jgi:peptidoglycan hydrolase-like protein with peptidoglycan-binding domain